MEVGGFAGLGFIWEEFWERKTKAALKKKEKKRKTKAEETVHVNCITWVAHPSNTLDTPLARGGLEPWGNV